MFRIRLLFMTTVLVGLLVGLAGAAEHGPATARQEGDMDVLLDTIRANRRGLVEVNLALSPDEAAKFWPVYDRYQQEMNAIGDRLAAIVQDYIANFRDLSNDKALKLMEDYLAAEADRIKVRRDYLSEFSKVLPGRTVARFYQIDNKIDAVLRYDLAGTIPVVEEARGAPVK
jgi:hypothetical protein